MKSLLKSLGAFSLALIVFFILLALPETVRNTYAACVTGPNDSIFICKPTIEDCVYTNSSTLQQCVGFDAATSKCECKAVNTPPGQRFGTNQVTCNGGPGFQTAIGCIPTEPGGFAGFFLKYLIGLAAAVAFFLIFMAGFQILTSSGNPEKIEGGKQLLTAAVVGLLFLIFAVIILQIINVDILGKVPGFPDFTR